MRINKIKSASQYPIIAMDTNTFADKTQESKALAATNNVSKKQSIKGLIDNRPAAIAQLKLKEMLQLKKAVPMLSSEVAQLQPKKREDSDDYFDPDFPGLELTKLRYDKFQIKGTDTVLFFEPGEGYYTDEALTQKADISSFVAVDEREGISNAQGQMYDSRDEERDGIITMATAQKILQRFFEEEPQHEEVHDFKVARILEAIDSRTPLPSIVIEERNGVASLVDGRHRIIASMKRDLKYIPYSSKTY